MLYEMIIMSSTSQLYCQTKMNLKKVMDNQSSLGFANLF